MICDASEQRCFPRNGDCIEDHVCPAFGMASQFFSVVCGKEDSLCHAEGADSTVSPPFFAATEIKVSLPEPGSVVPSASSLEVVWSQAEGPAIVELLNTAEVDRDTFTSAVVWGATLKEGGARRLQWSDGHAVVNGVWQAGPPPDAVPAGTYYVVVQGVAGDDLSGLSQLIPIWIGDDSAWKEPGDSCALLGIPGDCRNPARPQACVDGVCAQVCASHADCAPLLCLDPRNGFRVCGQ